MDDNSKQGFARVPVTITPVGWRKPTELEAVCGEVRGRGTSQAKAAASVAEQLAAMAGRAADFLDATVWADDSGAWFAYPDVVNGGHHAVRVHGLTATADARVSCTSSGQASAAEAFETSEGMRKITTQRAQAGEKTAYQDLAETIARQAEALAAGTVKGSKHAMAQLLLSNAQMLAAWTEDDRR